MSLERDSGTALSRWYRERIGEPNTADEITGYWIFVIGMILGILGIGLFLTTDGSSEIRRWAIVFAASGLVLLLAGPIIRLPLRRLATLVLYLGVVICAVAIAWFAVTYPENWDPTSGQTTIVSLYAVGLLIIAIGGVFVPVLAGRSPPGEADALRAEADDLRAGLSDTEADEADLAVQLQSLHESQARFELYEDSAGEYRWRLRHRNGNVIADSGESYTRRHDAQQGLTSVQRNALGAAVLLIEPDEELPPEEEFDPFDEAGSNATFELYTDGAGEYRWRLRHDNGDVIADSGEGYVRRQGAEEAIDRIQTYAGPANYLRVDPTAFEIYRDASGEWRWRLLHRNGNVLADSGQGYTRRRDARRAVDRVREAIDEFEFDVYEDTRGEYRWRLTSSNARIVADSGEGYASQRGAEEAVERVDEYASEADVLDVGWAAFELYEDSGGEHRWRLRHRNGSILADSGQGYGDWSAARDGVESVKRNAPNAETDSPET